MNYDFSEYDQPKNKVEQSLQDTEDYKDKCIFGFTVMISISKW